MTAPPLPTFSTPRRSHLWLWLTLGGFVVLTVFGLLAFGVYRVAHRFSKEYAPLAATLPAEIAGAKKEGLPTTIEDLRPKPPVSDADNAAQTYRKLIALYSRQSKKAADADKTFVTEHLKVKARTPQNDQEIRAYLKTYATELTLSERAAQKPQCDFARDWSKGFNVIFPELSVMRSGARLLMLRAAVESDENQPIPALHDVTLAAKVAQHSASDPTLIASLVKIAILAVANRRFVEILQRHGNDSAIFPAAQEAATALADPIDLRRVFGGEMVLGRATIQNITASDTADLPGGVRLPANVQVQQQMKAAWEARMIANWRTVQRQLRNSHGDLLASERALNATEAEEQAHRFEAGYELNAALNPVYGKAIAKVMQNQATANLRAEMLALLKYRQKWGNFPGALSELPDAAKQNDPFTNQPLGYKTTAMSFVIYSVSNNRKDDGGSDKSVKLGDSNWPEDIVVAYP